MEPLDEDWEQGKREAADRFATVVARWRAIPTEPHLLTFSGPLEDRPHRFCPGAVVPGAICPNCEKPLLHLLSIETSLLPFWQTLVPVAIHLLYCWTCAIPYDFFSYRIRQDGSIDILKYLQHYADSFGPSGPYDGYTGTYPESRVGLRALSEEEQRLARQFAEEGFCPEEYQYLADPAHQIGGFPKIHNSSEVQCPACQREAPFFATICDNAVGQCFQPDPLLTFAGYSGVQMVFHWCAECAVMTAYHSCD